MDNSPNSPSTKRKVLIVDLDVHQVEYTSLCCGLAFVFVEKLNFFHVSNIL